MIEFDKMYISKDDEFIVQITGVNFDQYNGRVIHVIKGGWGYGNDYWTEDGKWRGYSNDSKYNLKRQITKEEFPELFL